jgi:serine protease Do
MRRSPLLCVLALIPVLLVLGSAVGGDKKAKLTELQGLEKQIGHAVVKASVSTVAITKPGIQNGPLRTGMIVDPRFVVTDSSNLIGFPKELIVIDQKGKRVQGTIVGRDWRLRLAGIALKEPLSGGELEKTAKEDPGRFVIACGRGESESGLALSTVGIISARSRFSGRAVQIGCDLNQSIAGGPVVDLEGKIYGVSILLPHAVSRDSGVGFMVPWRILEKSLSILRQGKNVYPASFGLLVPERDIPGLVGIPVVDVRPKGPADRVGIEKGDTLLAIGDRPLESIYDLATRLARLTAGDTVSIKVKKSSGTVVVLEMNTDRRN